MEELLKKEIIEKHGSDVIELRKGDITKEQRWALMALSNTWIISSLRQGYAIVFM